MVAGARAAFDALLRTFIVSVTRQQWEEWLYDNLAAFRATMLTVQTLRRQRSRRVRARKNLPRAVTRLQPRGITDGKCHSDWARKLQFRTGWHGLRTRRNGSIVVFLIHLNYLTHYVHVRMTCKNPPQCTLRTDFDITASVLGLDRLETMLADDEVLQLFEFLVTGEAAISRGVCITFVGQR